MALSFIEILKVVFLGIVEGVTEWLPISSTGHMLLVDEFISLNASTDFKEMFFVVIQLGAILAVVTIFWNKMWPFQLKDKTQPVMKKDTWSMWFKTVVACIPGAIVTILFDNYIEAHLHTAVVIAIALIFYGIAFIVIENWNKTRTPKVETLNDITYKTAFLIGMFQVLSIIIGCVVAYLVSIVVIKFLMSYIKKHDFKIFGWYRIVLGVIVLAYFALFA